MKKITLTTFFNFFWKGDHNSHNSFFHVFSRGRRPKTQNGHFKNVQNRFATIKLKFQKKIIKKYNI